MKDGIQNNVYAIKDSLELWEYVESVIFHQNIMEQIVNAT